MKKQGFAIFSLCLFACLGMACVGSVQTVSDNENVGEINIVGDSAEAEDTTPPPVIALPKGEGGQGGEAGGSGDVGGSDQGMKVMINLAAETPVSAIVVGGKNQWVRYSIYDIENVTDQPQQIVGVDIAQGDPNGDVADFVDVGLETVIGGVRPGVFQQPADLLGGRGGALQDGGDPRGLQPARNSPQEHHEGRGVGTARARHAECGWWMARGGS